MYNTTEGFANGIKLISASSGNFNVTLENNVRESIAASGSGNFTTGIAGNLNLSGNEIGLELAG